MALVGECFTASTVILGGSFAGNFGGVLTVDVVVPSKVEIELLVFALVGILPNVCGALYSAFAG